jgi:DnaK suppressor protein
MSAARHLTRAQLRELERDLRREIARLERSVPARRAGAGDEGVPSGAAFDRPSDSDGARAFALKARTLGRHQTLVAALRCIEEGTYGICLGCREPIPYGRLLVVPEAAQCVACGSGV